MIALAPTSQTVFRPKLSLVGPAAATRDAGSTVRRVRLVIVGALAVLVLLAIVLASTTLLSHSGSPAKVQTGAVHALGVIAPASTSLGSSAATLKAQFPPIHTASTSAAADIEPVVTP